MIDDRDLTNLSGDLRELRTSRRINVTQDEKRIGVDKVKSLGAVNEYVSKLGNILHRADQRRQVGVTHINGDVDLYATGHGKTCNTDRRAEGVKIAEAMSHD